MVEKKGEILSTPSNTKEKEKSRKREKGGREVLSMEIASMKQQIRNPSLGRGILHRKGNPPPEEFPSLRKS